MQYCNRCGNEISDDSIFCNKCGYEVSRLTIRVVGRDNKIANAEKVHKEIAPSKDKRLKYYEILAIIFMPYIGFFIIIFKRPYKAKTNYIIAIYC